MSIRSLTRFRLRTLLFLVAVVAVLAGSIRRAVDQYHVEQETLRQLSEFRFPLTVKVRRPWWVPDGIGSRFTRVFDRVVDLRISGQTMDWDRGLTLDNRNFDDEHLRLVARLRHLERVDVSFTLVSAESIDELVVMRSLTALDVSGTQLEDAGISEFKRRRPDCFVCDSQPAIVAHLQSNDAITIGDERGQLHDVKRLLTDARRGPEAFGYVPQLYIYADQQLVRRRAQMIREVRQAAIDAGYQSIQVE